jgi:hypothetical protein
MRYVLGGVAFLLGMLALGWLFAGNDFQMYKYFAPREEQVRHDTFECSASHTDGLVRELRQIKDEYQKADSAGRGALADTFKHDYDGYTCEDLPSDLISFRSAL